MCACVDSKLALDEWWAHYLRYLRLGQTRKPGGSLWFQISNGERSVEKSGKSMKPRRVLNGEPLEEVNKFKGAGSMFIANKQGKSYPWCGMSLHTKGEA